MLPPTALPATLALVGLGALLLSPGLFVGPSLDPAVFVHVAGEMRKGEALYLDIFDHKPPGIYVIYLLGQLLLPFLHPWVTAWLISLLATTGVGLLIVAIARRLDVSPGLAWLAAASGVAAMSQYLLALGGGLTEPIAALPLAAALFLALRAGKPSRDFAAGALLAATLLVAIPLLPGVLAVVWIAVRTGGSRALLRLFAGSVLPALAAAVWLWAIGAMPAAIDVVVGYSAAYRLTNADTGRILSAPVITWTVLALLFLIVPASLGLLAGWRSGRLRREAAIGSAAWIGLSVVLFAYQGRFFAHYAIPLAIPLSLLAAMGFERIKGMAARMRVFVSRLAVFGPMILALVISLAAGLAGARMEWLPVARDHDRSQRVAAAVREVSAADEPIWIWGNESQLYLEAERSSATDYAYLYPLVTPGFSTVDMVDKAISDLRAERPPVIVDAGSRAPGIAGFQQLLIPRPLTSDGRNLDILDPLRDAVRDGYMEQATVDGWVIYVLRGNR